MAYGAVVSVAGILNQLLNSDRYSVGYPQLEYLYTSVCSLQSSLDELSPAPRSKRSEVEELEGQIRDVMYRAQDAIELFISREISSSADSDENSTSLLLQDLEEISEELDPITELAEEIGEERRNGITSPLPMPSSWRGGEMIGYDDEIRGLIDVMVSSERNRQVIPITGFGGTGKTTLARWIYENPIVVEHFQYRLWVTVSQHYDMRAVFSSLLSCIGHDYMEGDVNELKDTLYRSLYGRRYLVVIDDVWDPSVIDQLRMYLPDNRNRSRIIITSRDENVASKARSSNYHHVMQPLSEEDSWTLLCKRVFGEGECPPYLEEIGRNIARKCNGSPLLIVVIAGLLSQDSRDEVYWRSVAEDVHGAAGDVGGAGAIGIATASSEEYLMQVLTLSYSNLPGRLKPCFLYMAAFPEGSEILVSKLINFWVAEGFLTKSSPSPSSLHQSLEQVAKEHLQDLINRNLISIGKMSSDGQPKSCSLQGNLRQLAMQESDKEKFFHAINNYTQELPEGTKGQRRLSIHDNILLCSKDVYHCLKTIEFARTLLYAGPDHHHPFPHCLTFELLRVLDALSVYFVDLPHEFFELIHLRYLGYTCDEDLPSTITKLQNLLTLSVRQHPNTMFKRRGILPVEIWNMPQMRNLMIEYGVLPDQPEGENSVLFESLQSLSNINAACLAREILQTMPNLKKLSTWVEEQCVVQFDLEELQHLEVFKFTVLNPIQGHKTEFHPKLAFPRTLTKLSLSGCGLPWEDMEVIAELPNLQVLKLREFAFHGQEWRTDYVFEKLTFLLLESLDLEIWDADSSHFPVLERLVIRHCYQLENISEDIGSIYSLELIKLVDCNPNVVDSVDEIKREQEEDYDNTRLKFHIFSSYKKYSPYVNQE